MAEWRDGDDFPELPEYLRMFVASDWGALDQPLEPVRIGAQVPTSACAPQKDGVPGHYPTTPPDPDEPIDGLRVPRSTWVDDQGRWWRDVRILEAFQRFRDARRIWESAHPEWTQRRIAELVRRRIERRRLGTVFIDPEEEP